MLQSSYTQAELTEWLAQRTALRRVQATGTLRVTYGDRTVQYADGADLARALAALDARIGEAEAWLAPATARRATRRVTFIAGKGI